MKKLIPFLFLLALTGCASFWDAPKNIVGISVRDMEDGRGDALYQSYQADIATVFEAVIAIAQENKYYVFMKDDVRGLVVLMDIPGAVNTTEVGVFLTGLDGSGAVKVELSSRSTPAKRAVAQVLFPELAKKFSKV